MLCNLQIFSGGVCHLEQLHPQSPFLFPIVFSINLIPFVDFSSASVLAMSLFDPLFRSALFYLGLRTATTVAVCGFGSWALVVHCGLPRQTSPSSPNPLSNRSIGPPSFHNPTLSTNIHVVQICRFSLSAAADGLTDGSGERRTSPLNGDAQSLKRH